MNPFKLTETPFKKSDSKPEVFVTKGSDPYENTIKALKNIDLSPAKGKKVLLKPNAGRIAAYNSGVITNPQVLAAAIDAFNEAGAKVVVGESPITGVDTMEAFEVSGMAAVARERNCPLIDMDARPFVKTSLPEGVAIKNLMLCPEILEYDLIVSIPVMKTHMHTGVTLSMKNMKGCLWQKSKVKLHMLPPVEGIDEKPINIAIADMCWALRPHLAIIDGTIGMEDLGPSAGIPKPLGVVVVSTDAFAADAVACRLMEHKAEDIPHLRLAAARGFGEINLDNIAVSPENWQDYALTFNPPPSSVSLNFPNVKVLDENSCSACQSTILMFLKRYGDQLPDYFEKLPVNIAIGKGHKDVPWGTLCIGNCTAANKEKGIFIQGCPPVASKILSKISGTQKDDTADGHISG